MPEFTVTMTDTVQYTVRVEDVDAEAAEAYAVEHCTEDDTHSFIGVIERQAESATLEAEQPTGYVRCPTCATAGSEYVSPRPFPRAQTRARIEGRDVRAGGRDRGARRTGGLAGDSGGITAPEGAAIEGGPICGQAGARSSDATLRGVRVVDRPSRPVAQQ